MGLGISGKLGQQFFVCEEMVEEFLPVSDLAVLEDELESEIFEEEIFGGAEEGSQARRILNPS